MTSPDYDSKVALGENAPAMWMSEISYIESLLAQGMKTLPPGSTYTCLEWGSGNSTIHFTKFLLRTCGPAFTWYSIENFQPWYDKVCKMVAEAGLQKNVRIIPANLTSEPDKNRQEQGDLSDYVSAPKQIGVEFDFILIDGRRRAECMRLAPQLLARDGVVVLHDAERTWYHTGMQYLKGEFVLENPTPAAYGCIQKLWVGGMK